MCGLSSFMYCVEGVTLTLLVIVTSGAGSSQPLPYIQGIMSAWEGGRPPLYQFITTHV